MLSYQDPEEVAKTIAQAILNEKPEFGYVVGLLYLLVISN